jgi:hypothetical protein
MNSTEKTARMAGAFYLLFLVTQILAGSVRSRLVVYGGPAESASNILASTSLYRIGVVSDVLSAVFFLLAAWALYVLLKPVDRHIALLFLLLNLGGVAVQCTSLLFQFAALSVLSGTGYMEASQADQVQTLAMTFLDLHKNGFMLAQIFYGAWLFPLGYLVMMSHFLPRFLGILLIADFFGILIAFFQRFLFPGYELFTYPGLIVSFIAEFSLCFWLLIKGVKEQEPALNKAH